MESRIMMAVVDDQYVVRAAEVLAVDGPGVLANDTDVALLDYFDPTSALGAPIEWDADGGFRYDPRGLRELSELGAGETREDFFTYLAYGPREEAWIGTVRILIQGSDQVAGNRPPLAQFDIAHHTERSPLVVAAPGVLMNDTDPDLDDVIAVVGYDSVSSFGAAVQVNSDGSYTYTPTPQLSFDLLPGHTITDSFRYTVADRGGLQSSATVHVTYTQPLTLLGLFYGTNANEPLIVDAAGGLAGQRPDVSEPRLTVVQSETVSALGASFSYLPDGSFRYDPTAVQRFRDLPEGAVLEDVVRYQLTDGTQTSDGSISILVYGQADGPEDHFTATAARATEFAAPGLLANDMASPGLYVQAFDPVSQQGATITVMPDGSFRYDPSTSWLSTFLPPGEIVQDHFYYKHRDNLGNRKTILVTIDVTGYDHPFFAASDDYQTDNQSVLRVAAPGLLANDYDVDDLGKESPNSLQIIDAKYNRPGDANRDGVFNSSDLIQALSAGKYEDGVDDSAIWEQGDWNTDGEFDNTDLILALLIGDYENYDPDPVDLAQYDLSGDGRVDSTDQLLARQNDLSLKGARVNVAADGSFVYDPGSSSELMALPEGETVIDEFLYSLTDSRGRTQPSFVRVSVTGRTRLPEAIADRFEVTDGESRGVFLDMNVLRNDRSYASDETLVVTGSEITSRLGAMVEVQFDGTLNYDSSMSDAIVSLQPGQSLVDEFTYTIEDVHGRRAMGLVSMRVFGRSEAPDDLYVSAKDSLRTVLAPGVLANDPAFGINPQLVVTGFDAVSARGAAVTVQPDGGFHYDPRGAAAFRDLPPRQVVYDYFTYTTAAGPDAVRYRVNMIVSPSQQNSDIQVASREPLPALPAGVQLVTKVAEQPYFGSRSVEAFYAGKPEVYRPNAEAPTSRYEWEIIDFRGEPMLKIALLPALGGDNTLWRLQDHVLTTQMFVRTGPASAVHYSVDHPLPPAEEYRAVWLVGFDRGENPHIDVHGTKPVVVSGGNMRDVIEAKNLRAQYPLPGEEFYLRVETGQGDDLVLGSGARDRIDVGEGNDVVRAGSGDDLILGGPGKDSIDGEGGQNLANPGEPIEGDIITNALLDLPTPSLDVINRKLKPKELGKTEAKETLWFDDAVPPGANWVEWRDHRNPVEITTANGLVSSGSKAFQVSPNGRGFQFENAASKLVVQTGDKLITYVYLDPTSPPSRIALNFRAGNWAYGAYWGPAPTLAAGQELKRGQSLWSADGSLELVLQQSDGNLVLVNRAQGNRVLWATNATGGERAVVQSDGNFVVYRGDQSVAWASGTFGNQVRLNLQQDGNLVLTGSDGSVKWAAGSNRDVEILHTTRIGDMPKAGTWVKLEIDPTQIGLKVGDSIDGMFFRAIGGTATFDRVGVSQTRERDEAIMTVKLTRDVLSILGRDNYGFQVRGNWSVSDNNGAETFSAAGPMTLISKIGEVPFLAPPISILTKSDGISGSGIVNQPSISFAGMDLKTTAISTLNDVFGKIGLNMTLSGMQFGVALGKTLTEGVLKAAGAPLNDAIPYLFFSSFNAPQVSFGDIGIGLENTAGMVVVFDPADPFLFVSGMDPRGDVLAVGYSHNGYIPYSPLRNLDERIGDDMFGNIYARGKVVIPVKAFDLGVDGELTIDTDLNDDGTGFFDQVGSDFFPNLFKGLPGQEHDQFVSAITDLGIGINGKLTVAMGKNGIGIEVPVGSASALVKGEGKLAFSGGSVNPWQGTFLERFNTTGSVDINGFASAETFVMTAKMETSKFGPLQVGGTIKFTNRDITAELETKSPIPSFPTMKIKGSVSFDGDFKLHAESRRGFDFGPFSSDISFALGMSKTGTLYQLDAAFIASARMNVLICKDLEVSFRASGLVGMGEVFEFNFRSNFRIFCDTPWYNPVPDIGPYDLGFNVDNRGLSLPLPGPLPNLRVNF